MGWEGRVVSLGGVVGGVRGGGGEGKGVGEGGGLRGEGGRDGRDGELTVCGEGGILVVLCWFSVGVSGS